MDSIWKDKLKSETAAEAAKGLKKKDYKGSFEEIKEVEEEYIYASNILSHDNTERLLSNNSSIFLKDKTNDSTHKPTKIDIDDVKLGGNGPRNVLPLNEMNIAHAIHKIASNSVTSNSTAPPPSNSWPERQLKEMPGSDENHCRRQNLKVMNTVTSIEVISDFVNPQSNVKAKDSANFKCSPIKPITPKYKQKKEKPSLDDKMVNNFNATAFRASYSPKAHHEVTKSLKKLKKTGKVQSHSELVESLDDLDFQAYCKDRIISTLLEPKMLKKFTSSKDLSQHFESDLPANSKNQSDTRVNFFSFHSKQNNTESNRQEQNCNSFSKNLKFSINGASDSKIQRLIHGKKLISHSKRPSVKCGTSSEALNFSRKSEEKGKRPTGSSGGSFSRVVNSIKRPSLKSPHRMSDCRF